MKEYARKPGRGQNDALADDFRQVCRVMESRTHCEKCYQQPLKYVISEARGNGVFAWVGRCEDCLPNVRSKSKSGPTTTAAMNDRIREIEKSNRVTYADMVHRLREIESGERKN